MFGIDGTQSVIVGDIKSQFAQRTVSLPVRICNSETEEPKILHMYQWNQSDCCTFSGLSRNNINKIKYVASFRQTVLAVLASP